MGKTPETADVRIAKLLAIIFGFVGGLSLIFGGIGGDLGLCYLGMFEFGTAFGLAKWVPDDKKAE